MSRTTYNVVDEVYRLLREEGREAGERLGSESELAGHFHVSRAVMREALRVLEREGAVSVRPGVGGGVFAQAETLLPLVRSLKTQREILGWTNAEIGDAYVELMAHVARLVAVRAEPDEIQALEESNRAWVSGLQTGNVNGAARAHAWFDEGLREAAHSPVLSVLAEALEILRDDEDSDETGQGVGGHEAGRVAYSHGYILEALRRGSPEEAAERMRRHMEGGNTHGRY